MTADYIVTIDEIPNKRFKGGNVGRRQTPRTWFKRFVQLWPGFKAAPLFTVNDNGRLEYRAVDGVVALEPDFLFPDLPGLAIGATVRVSI